MFRVALRELAGARDHMSGYTLGEAHCAEILRRVTEGKLLVDPDTEGSVVVLDFREVDAVTTSYLKGVLLHLLMRGRAAVDRRETGVAPLNVFPLIANANEEVRGEIEDLMRANDSQSLVIVRADTASVVQARLLGRLDPALRSTLEAICRAGLSTATELHQQALAVDRVTVTAWNNRLSDLLARRLVRRKRSGRQHIFVALAREVTIG